MATPPPAARTSIVLVVALQAEIAHLVANFGSAEQRTSGIWSEFHISLPKADVVIVQSGVGMTSSAAATEHAISAHRPWCVLNFGSGGAHVRDILPGDIVIASRVIACNTLQVLATGEEYFVERQFRVEGQPVQRGGSVIECDPALIRMARRAAAYWTPDPWPNRSPRGHFFDRQPAIRVGPVISADMWVQSPERIDALHRRHQSLAADMEAAAIAQVAHLHDLPFLSIKDISNNELYVNTNIRLGEITAPIEEIGKRSAALMARLLTAVADQVS